MKIIHESRGAGKTTKLLELANKKAGYNLVVCMSEKEVNRLWKIILDNKFDLPQPITFDDFINKRYYWRNVNKIFIDNADAMIQMMGEGKVQAISINKDSKRAADGCCSEKD